MTSASASMAIKIRLSRIEIRSMYLLNPIFLHSTIECIPVDSQIDGGPGNISPVCNKRFLDQGLFILLDIQCTSIIGSR